MRKVMWWSTLTVALMLAAVVGLYWAYWGLHARFQPRVVTGDTAEVQRLLDEAGWVSNGGGGAALYLVGWRDCESCNAYQASEFDYLRTVGVEPRVILIARPDEDGLPRSTAGERSTVAELWVTRDWTLFQRWSATPSRNWTAAGIPPADGNAARTGVVEQGRDFQARLETALRGSGMRDIRYPLVLWRDSEGTLMACACSDARAWAFVRDNLGHGARESDAPNVAPPPVEHAPVAIEVDPSPVPYPDVAGDRPQPTPPPNVGPSDDIGPNVVIREPTSEGPVRQPRPAQPRPATPRPTQPRPESRPSQPSRPTPTRPTPRPEAERPAPQRPAPSRPATPREPVRPQTDDDTLFY